ncbi:MAG: dual specificity protein phosphatase family protein [Chloroflexota bacterium]|nr:dual specificity protein phosphatase family protein [Chloroflexota bacterium]
MQFVRALTRWPPQAWTYAKVERITWLHEEGLAACGYPRDDQTLRELARSGVSFLINLHERAHPSGLLGQHGLTELHLPVADFSAPTPSQVAEGVSAIEEALAAGQRVAVHCGAGLGRTGTLLACYLVRRGLGPSEAIARMRALRPGSVETAQQEAAVVAFAREHVRAQA